MNGFAEIGLIAGREIKKNFRSIKGIILLVISLLGAGGVALVLAYIDKQDLSRFPPEEIREGFEQLLSQKFWYGDDIGNADGIAASISHSPPTLYFMMWGSVWLTPLVMAILGFDGISGELQNRTVRYWNIRSRRWAYYLGKVLGLWVVVSGFILMIHASVWCVAASFGIAPWGEIFKWGIRLYLVTVPITGAWCGICTLVGSNFRVPILALLATCGVFFLLWMFKGIGLFPSVHDLVYLYPNTYDEWLLSPKPQRVLAGVGALLGFLFTTTALGAFIFERRDV